MTSGDTSSSIRNTMTDRNLSDLHPDLQPLCQQWLDQCNADPVFVAAGATVFITQTYRSDAEQDADYAKGRTAPGVIITNAKAGQSKHNFTLPDGTPASKAFDFGVKNADGSCDWSPFDPLWQRAIAIGESLGLISGSTFHSIKDFPHFEIA